MGIRERRYFSNICFFSFSLSGQFYPAFFLRSRQPDRMEMLLHSFTGSTVLFLLHLPFLFASPPRHSPRPQINTHPLPPPSRTCDAYAAWPHRHAFPSAGRQGASGTVDPSEVPPPNPGGSTDPLAAAMSAAVAAGAADATGPSPAAFAPPRKRRCTLCCKFLGAGSPPPPRAAGAAGRGRGKGTGGSRGRGKGKAGGPSKGERKTSGTRIKHADRLRIERAATTIYTPDLVCTRTLVYAPMPGTHSALVHSGIATLCRAHLHLACCVRLHPLVFLCAPDALARPRPRPTTHTPCVRQAPEIARLARRSCR